MVEKSVNSTGSHESVPIVELGSIEAFATLLFFLIGLIQFLNTQQICGC